MTHEDQRRTEADRAWDRIEQKAQECRRTWGMGFPVISLALLRGYWREATGYGAPAERSEMTPKR